ncbi:hypothetical protein KJ632_00320, partial [Patescibacteria group bacterium]|nr:hypothetical protein [Patescibacteria group bacterium]
MSSLEHSSEKPLNKLVWAIIIVAFLGLFDASYLTAEHYYGTGLNCIVFEGCDTVANSEYSTMFGFPVALYGVAFYLTVLL